MLLRERDDVLVFLVAAWTNAFRGNKKEFALEPSAGIDNRVLHRPAGVIEDHIFYFAQLLVFAPVERCATDIVSGILETEIMQSAEVSHRDAPELDWPEQRNPSGAIGSDAAFRAEETSRIG